MAPLTYTVHSRLTLRPILHRATCSPPFTFSQAGMCGVRTSRVQTGLPTINQPQLTAGLPSGLGTPGTLPPRWPTKGRYCHAPGIGTCRRVSKVYQPVSVLRRVVVSFNGPMIATRNPHHPLSEWPTDLAGLQNPLNRIRARYAELAKGV